jgi:hypothetical protein
VAEDGNGGRVLLVGANVTNSGTISTPAGQTILAAGLQVGIDGHRSADPSLRGLDVYVGKVTKPAPQPDPIAVMPTRVPEVVVAKVEPLPPPTVKEPVIDAGEETIEIEPTPEPLPKLPKQKTPKLPIVTTVPPKEKPKNDAPPPKEKDEAIPEGEGKLVINVSGGSGDVVVDGTRWDTTPVQNKLPSGTHKVTVKLPDGQSAVTRVAVWPDKTTRLTLDSSSLKWSQSQ